jgi:hypothetical protein
LIFREKETGVRERRYRSEEEREKGARERRERREYEKGDSER